MYDLQNAGCNRMTFYSIGCFHFYAAATENIEISQNSTF